MHFLYIPDLALHLKNKLGDTPLHCAAVRGHTDVVKILLEHGAERDIVNRWVCLHCLRPAGVCPIMVVSDKQEDAEAQD